MSRVFSETGVDATSGKTDTMGLVTKFRISTVPDGASALSLLGFGLGGLSALRRKLF